MSSFDEGIALEEQPIYQDLPDFNEKANKLSNKLIVISNDIQKLKQSLGFFDKYLNKDYSYQQFNKYQKNALQLINKLMAQFRDITADKKYLMDLRFVDISAVQKFQKDQLVNGISDNLNEFKELQNWFTRLDSKLNEMEVVEQEARIQQQQQQQAQEGEQIIIEYEPINAAELEYQQDLINERELEIENIANGIVELNELFQDLGTLVTSQGELMDNIENNLYSVVDDSRAGHSELRRAEAYQKRSTGLCMWLLVILAVILLFILLIIFA
ncbi:hypothetical protein LJB42_000538 [Komagataella kurtzmanii]|nr:hypothetical protein LJB42_000538 [Komagataella kurtzmanii]